MGVSGPSLLIESTDSMMMLIFLIYYLNYVTMVNFPVVYPNLHVYVHAELV